MSRFIFVVLLFCAKQGVAQHSNFQLSYFSPFTTHIGSVFGADKCLNGSSSQKHFIHAGASIGYFIQPRVSRNTIASLRFRYIYARPNKRFAPRLGVDFGIMNEWSKQEGALNLATGEIEYDLQREDYSLHLLALGFEYAVTPSWKPYFNASFGNQYRWFADYRSLFFGAEIGVIFVPKNMFD